MRWVLELVGIWFGTLAVALLVMFGGYWLYDLLADRRDWRQIATEESAAMERYRRQAHRLGLFAEQLEEIQGLPEVHR